jgi:hypothetical protein
MLRSEYLAATAETPRDFLISGWLNAGLPAFMAVPMADLPELWQRAQYEARMGWRDARSLDDWAYLATCMGTVCQGWLG